ncbi:hypothetical protein [Allosphingosinicella vermicomposti]|uniref:hypothetical protein n=1 Tax=Allosphingosinicella vermicomposti TaxID=614671 RepID=UPI000D0F5BCA|nr:hypothetical protein [Allosphingosinicella vermicomposti]
MLKFLVPFAAVIAVPVSAQDTSRLDKRAELVRTYSAQYADYWNGQKGRGKATVYLPSQFEIPQQYATSVTKAERQLMGRRLRALVDFILAQPALQDADVEVSVEPTLYRVNLDGGYLQMILDFKIQKGSDKADFQLWTNPYAASGEVWRNVGTAAGGCRREQLASGMRQGIERLRVGKAGPGGGTAIRALEIVSPTLRFKPSDEPYWDAESITGRIAALGYNLDCTKLLALSNTP